MPRLQASVCRQTGDEAGALRTDEEEDDLCWVYMRMTAAHGWADKNIVHRHHAVCCCGKFYEIPYDFVYHSFLYWYNTV